MRLKFDSHPHSLISILHSSLPQAPTQILRKYLHLMFPSNIIICRKRECLAGFPAADEKGRHPPRPVYVTILRTQLQYCNTTLTILLWFAYTGKHNIVSGRLCSIKCAVYVMYTAFFVSRRTLTGAYTHVSVG